ncbi:1-phosphofructokinase [Spiroplasma culicicola]|uniref:1-phosphofructokinase n=1 Tax=Spiroplasma culicicola AES-1 TaxID=1276246 RepID=W6A773_9MOLU|nr:1-phosphofructokinase family hexose kinase [Spiroplasma culicicola]AHI52826.1 1-phosphofructokinase [Spiroplasma culicicola AES-1]
MIYTITLNPAIDHIILADKPIDLGITNYYNTEYKVVGGKGINAGVILKNLQSQVQAIGIMGLDNKEIFLNKFEEINLNYKFFYNQGSTRVNYKIKHLASHQETELNGLGFEVTQDTLKEFLDYLKDNLKPNDIVMVTGSVARGVQRDIYEIIGQIVNQNSALLVCDATNDLLINALKQKPYLIKPNLEEICSTLNIEFNEDIDFEQTKDLIKQLQGLGARNILLSKGSQGSLYFDENNDVYQVGIATGKLINSVGAGDSMLAGFVHGIDQNFSVTKTLQFAAASGAATAFNEWLASKDEIIALVDQIKVEKI